MAATPISQEVAENVAAQFMADNPTITKMCADWNLSRPSVRAIIDGTHPSLTAMTKRKLAKLCGGKKVTVKPAKVQIKDGGDIKALASLAMSQLAETQKTLKSLARASA